MTRVDRFIGYVFPFLAGFILLFFVPTWAGLEISKTYYIVFSAGISALILLVGKLYDRSFLLPNKKILLWSFLFLLIILISSATAPVPWLAFFGRAFESLTFGSMFFLMIFLLLGIYTFQSISATKRYTYVMLFLFIPVLLFQVGHIFFPSFLTLGTFFSPTSTIVGTWHEMGIMAVAVGFVALSILTYKKVARKEYVILACIALGSAFLILLVNMTHLFIIACLLSGGVALFSALEHKKQVSSYVIPLLFCAVMVAGLFGQGQVNRLLQNRGLSYSEVKPAFDSTFTVLKRTIQHDPILGAGPNHFSLQWLTYKPTVINSSPFFTTPFNAGYSTFFTLVISYGPIAGLFVLVAILVYIFMALRSLIRFSRSTLFTKELFYTKLFFIVSLLYLYMFFTQNIGMTTWIMFLSAISIVLGHLHVYGVLKPVSVSLDGVSGKKRKLTIFGTIILASALLFMVILSAVKVSAYALAQKGDHLLSVDESRALIFFQRAYALDHNDLYARVISQIYFKKVNEISGSEVTAENREVLQTYFKNVFQGAVQAGQSALSRNGIDLENFVNLISIYRSVIPVVETAYPQAVSVLDNALLVSPNNPTLYLLRARLELDMKNTEQAKKFALSALDLKPNYADAYVLLSRIALLKEDTAVAKKDLELALFYDQTNLIALSDYVTILFAEKNYQGASEVLGQMLSVNPELHQARFYLAVALDRLGKRDDAIAQLEILKRYLPGNADVENALVELKKNGTLSSSTEVLPVPEESGTDREVAP